VAAGSASERDVRGRRRRVRRTAGPSDRRHARPATGAPCGYRALAPAVPDWPSRGVAALESLGVTKSVPDLKALDRSLPRKRMAAGVLFFDEVGRVLLVDPVYKQQWDIPGGVVELDESPRQAAAREVAEELGLQREPGPLLGIDWVPARAEWSEGLIMVFDGGLLSSRNVESIVLPPQELRSCAFVEVASVGERLSPAGARRVQACVAARSAAVTVYLEGGRRTPVRSEPGPRGDPGTALPPSRPSGRG